MTSRTTNKFSPEVRERAVRLVLDHEVDHSSRWTACQSIATTIGCSAHTLLDWVKRAEINAGKRAGMPMEMAEKMNEHATQVLNAYLDAQTHPVPHAVLIEGRWGAGKTHFLRETYEPARAERAERQGRHHVPFLFVSLFGATSAQDVEMRIFRTACPGEAVAGSIAGTIALGIGEFFQVTETAKGTLKAFGRRAIRRLNEFVFVLDDLERVEPNAIGEVMGLVASMVGEHQRRVILVADEAELRKRFVDYEWDRRAEKVIGRRAEIRPDFADMAAKLVLKLPDGHARDFLRDRTEQILDVVSMSETRNLRDLAWALHNAASFAECLLEDGDIPADHITRTVQVVVAVSLWSRSGRADRGALENLPELSVLIHMDLFKSHQEEMPERDPRRDVAKKFMERFAALNVESPPIDYATILNFEQGGAMDGEALRLQVKKQFGFGKDHAEPSWRVLWHSRKHTFEETEQALNELAQELTERRYARSGDLLHAIGQAIKFRDAGDARLTNDEEIVPFFERYIDDLQQADLLDPVPDGMFSEDSSDGLGIASTESEEFKTLHHYLRKKRAEAKKAKQRREVDAILQAFALGETDELFRLVRNDDPLSRSPVLSALATDEVADLFTRNPISLDAAGKLLAYRYNDLTPKGPLEAELSWARLVVTAIQERVGRWDDPHRSLGLKTFRGIIRHYEQAREPGLQILPEDEERPA